MTWGITLKRVSKSYESAYCTLRFSMNDCLNFQRTWLVVAWYFNMFVSNVKYSLLRCRLAVHHRLLRRCTAARSELASYYWKHSYPWSYLVNCCAHSTALCSYHVTGQICTNFQNTLCVSYWMQHSRHVVYYKLDLVHYTALFFA